MGTGTPFDNGDPDMDEVAELGVFGEGEGSVRNVECLGERNVLPCMFVGLLVLDGREFVFEDVRGN